MEKDMQQLHQIRASRETFSALENWYEQGFVNTIIPRPLEYGLLIFDEQEYVLFDRNDDIVRYAWHKNDQPYARFEFNLITFALDNIATVVPMEPSEEVYKPFFYITSVYCGAMAFIIANVGNDKAVKVSHKGHTRYYDLEHEYAELGEMSVEDSAKGQLMHHFNYGKHA